MTAKEYLKQAFTIDRDIKAKEEQLEWLKQHAVYLTPQLEEKIDASQSYKSKMEEVAVKIMETQASIAIQIQELVKKKAQVAEAIKSVGNPEYECLLEMRYLAFMGWDEIASRMNYSGKYVFEVHGRALKLVRIPT